MDTIVLLLVIGASTFGAILLVNRLRFESPVVHGYAPVLAIIGLTVIALSVDRNSLFLLSAAVVTATICGCVWLNRRESESKSEKPYQQIRQLEQPSSVSRQDLPFQRRDTGRPPAKKPTGYRITSTGKRLYLAASNPRRKNSTDRRRADLKSVD